MENVSLAEQRKLIAIQADLSKQQIVVTEDWLVSTLKGLGAFTNPAITSKHVYRKWLNADITKIGLTRSSFPAEAFKVRQSSIRQLELTVQVNSIRDISKPNFEDKNDFMHLEEEETEGFDEEVKKPRYKNDTFVPGRAQVKIKSPRMLMMHLSDGYRTIKAIEYQPINCLSADLPLGTKLLLKGPMEIQVEVILLKPQNIQILGGEVEALKVLPTRSSTNPTQLPQQPFRLLPSQIPVMSSSPKSTPLIRDSESTLRRSTLEHTRLASGPATNEPVQDDDEEVMFDDEFDDVLASLNNDSLQSIVNMSYTSTRPTGSSSIPIVSLDTTDRFGPLSSDDDVDIVMID